MAIRNRIRLLKILLVGTCLWLGWTIFMSFYLRTSKVDVDDILVKVRLDDVRLRQLMSPPDNPLILPEPLSQLALPENVLNFYHLPLRKADRLYTEITSSNRDRGLPEASEVSINRHNRDSEITFYEDYGPGCVYRIHLLPRLTGVQGQPMKRSINKLGSSIVKFEVDDKIFQYKYQQIMEALEWPWLAPISTQHYNSQSGVGSYTPLCYQHSMKITLIVNDAIPKNPFEATAKCRTDEAQCPFQMNSAVSRHKFPIDVQAPSFASFLPKAEANEKHQAVMSRAVTLLKHPELYGPIQNQSCILDCVEMCPDCTKEIFSHTGPGVISTILLRVFETSSGKMETDWSLILLTAHFDDSPTPQLNRVPLGSLVGVTGSLNDFRGAAAGHRRRHCGYNDSLLSMPKDAMLGYFYYPMPFWKKAIISIEGIMSIHTPLLACYQISVVPNFYSAEQAGLFHINMSYYHLNQSALTGYREMLSLDNAWGHVVGVHVHVDNMKTKGDGQSVSTSSVLEANPVLFLDGQNSASMLGTSLEHYFGYYSGDRHSDNVTDSFVGNYHSSSAHSENRSWYVYRQHILDPIVFHKSIKFVMAVKNASWKKRIIEIKVHKYLVRKAALDRVVSHMIMYYARDLPGMTLTDELLLGNATSESVHNLKYTFIKSSNTSSKVFQLSNKKYFGACNTDAVYNRTGREYHPGDKISFRLRLVTPNRGVVLRREFHSDPAERDQHATVFVNENYLGTWFIPMGDFSKEDVLRQDDFIIGESTCGNQEFIDVSIYPKTIWRDISYQALTMHDSEMREMPYLN